MSSIYDDPPPPSSEDMGTAILVILAVVVILAVKITAICCFLKRFVDRRNNTVFNAPPLLPHTRNIGLQQASSPIAGDSKNGLRFSYEVLARATEGFSSRNLIGQGGFGFVHRGVLDDGKEVAVKQLKEGSAQGEREFRAEVEIITRVHHRHLVSLVGYCIAEPHRILVYEFVPNSTLQFHLHGSERPTMEWRIRHTIALGSAKGIAYLHEDCHPKIIHRDIKASNILLDHNFQAKVSDFGLARFSSDTNTHLTTRIMGTKGYLAPEYASSGHITDKSDVYSFGVILLELITGRRPLSTDEGLVHWAKLLLVKALHDDNYDNLVDPRLQRNYDEKEMKRMVACAAACVRYTAKLRPPMSMVVRALETELSLEILHQGLNFGENIGFGNGSWNYEANQYREDMNMLKRIAMSSHDSASST